MAVELIHLNAASVDEYKFLEDMNKETDQRYKGMHKVAETISFRLKELNDMSTELNNNS